MIRSRVPAAAAAITLLLGAAVLWGKELPRSPSPITAPQPAATEESPVLVDPQVLDMRAVEEDLIDEATADITTTTTPSTTTPSTTTTLDVSTTTSSAPATTSAPSPSPTSPPTTQATPTTTAPSGGYNAAAENDFTARVNSYRASSDVATLARSGSLDSYARSWAKEIAANSSLSHSNIGSLLGEWSSVGENVGVGSSVGSIFDQLVASAPHDSNMLGDFTHFGIGVYQDSNGTLWTAHVFAR